MAIEAVVFDMDGVVVDSERYWVEELSDILATAVPDADVEPESVVGINVYDQYDLLADEHDVAVTREEYFDLFDQHAATVYTERAALTDGFHDLLAELRARDLPVALVTSSFPNWVDMVFERFDLRDAFDVVVTAAEEDVPGKPEPDLYELAAARLGVAPGDLLVVEDSEHGVAAADAAGAYVVGYQHGASAGMAHDGADVVATDPGAFRARILDAL
ncbi:HAD superfamily hydrolase (TIGR01509 family) [Halarchaeum rubridurum]|uniref:HAD superfamily hydrolase (TIGR01509 family) n=1 Tax=Halarchaeum rubridurum TaxID=489911 RepID=A0A830FY25_9EURY|nr:HAD family phosphatase [Halarchaeum rubridurum]MBP1953518.1 HAD superfamily hydrolase (TIGR01509 family) [Halarchaeum rubridurum]GGM64608.1 haloacid dehalogenase [Halarchaeum rubridurum]